MRPQVYIMRLIGRSLACLLTFCFVGNVLAADFDVESNIEVLGLDANAERYAIKVTSPGNPPVFLVYKIDENKREKIFPTESAADERNVISKLKSRYKIQFDGHKGQLTPNKKYTILGAPADDGFGYRILVMEKGRIGQLKRIELSEDKTSGTVAEGMLKQISWSQDASVLVIVLNEKLTTSNFSSSKDKTYPLSFKPWEIHWLPPPTPPK